MITVDFPAVPVPDGIAALIGSHMPAPVLQAEIAAECAAREAMRFRAPFCLEDQADREQQLAVLAWANKVLAAYNPGLIVTPKQVAA